MCCSHKHTYWPTDILSAEQPWGRKWYFTEFSLGVSVKNDYVSVNSVINNIMYTDVML